MQEQACTVHILEECWTKGAAGEFHKTCKQSSTNIFPIRTELTLSFARFNLLLKWCVDPVSVNTRSGKQLRRFFAPHLWAFNWNCSSNTKTFLYSTKWCLFCAVNLKTNSPKLIREGSIVLQNSDCHSTNQNCPSYHVEGHASSGTGKCASACYLSFFIALQDLYLKAL